MNVSAMSVYHHMTYPYTSTASQIASGQSLVGSSGSGVGAGPGPASPGCGCEAGRVVATDPVTGAAICSCQYDASPSRLSVSTHLNVNAYPRLAAPAPGSALHYSAAYAGGDPQSAYPSIGVDPAYFGSLGGAYGLKDSASADMGVYGGIGTTTGYGYHPYDPSLYGYGAPYDLAARRKNATREATGTLKAWMNEHKKNPYPTKGEKIMLAIITKMTLTQISTWFANARRRLKKENKMTWEPKNKTDSDDEDAKTDAKQENDTDKEEDKDTSNASATETYSPGASAEVKSEALSPSNQWKDKSSPLDCEVADPLKPKIWSLADTAVCKTPPQGVAWSGSGETRLACSDASGTTFPLPPTIGPGQLARFSHLTQAKSMSQSHAHQQSLSQTPSMSQAAASHSAGQPTSPTGASHYNHHSSSNSGYRGVNGTSSAAAYGPVPTYADPGTVTPPHTPPSAANKSTMSSKQPAASAASGMHSYQSTYPGVLSALERRTEQYPVQQLYRQQQHVQQMQQHVADMSQHAAARHMPEMNHYSAAYKESAGSSASATADYMTQMPGH